MKGRYAPTCGCLRLIGLFCGLVSVSAASEPLEPGALLRQLRTTRAERVKDARPVDYSKIDADIAAEASARLSILDPATIEPARGREWAGLYTMAEQHATACDLLRRYLSIATLSDAERHQGEMDLMLAGVKLNDGETVHEVLRSMKIAQGSAATLGSYFGGTFHHYVFNASGAQACLDIIARIEPKLPTGPFGNEEVRKSNGWARRQLTAAKALYLFELGRSDEAVAVLDDALATLDADIFRRNELRGDRQRYLLGGKPAPAITVDRTHGEFRGLDAYRGKVLLLEFTAHWCHACHAAIPALRQLYAELKDRGFEVVSLTTYYGFFGSENQKTKDMPRDEEFARMPAMLKKQDVSWPMVYTDRSTMAAYGVTGIPQIMLLDKQGCIRKIDLGFSEAKMARFKAEIERLLRE